MCMQMFSLQVHCKMSPLQGALGITAGSWVFNLFLRIPRSDNQYTLGDSGTMVRFCPS